MKTFNKKGNVALCAFIFLYMLVFALDIKAQTTVSGVNKGSQKVLQYMIRGK